MFFALGRCWGGLVFGRRTLRILTALVESSDDGMIRRLQLEDFHVSGERVIEVDLYDKAAMVVQDVACPVVQVLAVLLCRRPLIIAFVAPVSKIECRSC